VAKDQQVMEEKMLAALLCHEIKNPLNVVNFFLGVLEKEQQQQQQQQLGVAEAAEGSGGGSAPSGLHEALQQAVEAAQAGESGAACTSAGVNKFLGRQRALLHLLPGAIHCTEVMVDLVENCRHLAKVDSGTYAPQEEEINLRQIAESCLGVFGREREAGLVFDLHCPAELAIVSDRLLWRHVLMNLIGNAVKFTMHNKLREHISLPRVAVRIERDQHEPGVLRVEVSDNGPGIDAAGQAFIFGRFAQAGQGFQAPEGLRSGLGLHMSAKIVQVLRGKLDLTSPLQTDGHGTCFG
jgi:signal transduction histidine kinase